ncbi:MAG: pyridoxamine 5'-phosphate oxidase family protein [Opitutaceae bacterium]|jgi:nitroimidazol reductase NimA-like FMN-containing flavoprotein (pyridoxamine 5'-phosphate oxidase superfamily)|nr:pyridoxamine 5'-phosphate oxidase family protein [Opitutaceae bacterium]
MSIELKQTIHDYIALTRWAWLAIVREDGAPTIRPIGSFAPVDAGQVDIYFSTPLASAKVLALRRNPRASFYFEHDVLDIATYKAVSLIGEAVEVAPQSGGHAAAVAALSARSPHFRSRVEKGELASIVIFRVNAREIRFSDYSAGRGPGAIQELPL